MIQPSNSKNSQNTGPIPLEVQTSLSHRGGIAPNPDTLFPPAGTFEAIGGRPAVARLVDNLYDRFEADKVLRPAFSRDLTHERERVKLFFEAWFGGSAAYFDAGWPPGLMAAHGAVSISRGMAGRWVGHFLDAFAEAVPDPNAIVNIKPLITRMAMGLVNRDDEPVAGKRLRCGALSVDPKSLKLIQREDAVGIAKLPSTDRRFLHSQGPRLLLMASVRGKAKAVAALLEQGVDANGVVMLPGTEANATGLPMLRITPLCGALAKGRDEVVKLLVEHGAQYDIFTAAFVGDVDGVTRLLDLAPELANANDPACDVAQVTPLEHAVVAEQFGVAQLLLQRGAKVGANSARLIRSAANGGNEEMVDLLLEHGADPKSIGPGSWVLHTAIADKLVARCANVNYEPGKWIGFCCTGNSGHKENVALARAMLRCGADVTAQYKGGTALHCAARAGFAQVVEALVEYGANINALDDRGLSPLDVTSESGKSVNGEPVQRLLIADGGRRWG